MDSFESRLRFALAQDRAEYAAAPGMEARVRSVTRHRAAQRRAALVAGVAVLAVGAWLPLQGVLGGSTGGETPEAVRTWRNDGAATSPHSAPAPAWPHAGGTAPPPAPGGERPRSGFERGAPALGPDDGGTHAEARPHAPIAIVYPVVKKSKTSPANVDLVPIKTKNASAVASVVAMDVAEANAGLNVATVLSAVDGPDQLTVGAPGTWTATSPGATDAHWVNGDPASTPYEQTFTEPGTYEIVLDVTYDGLATMQCHRSVTVEPVEEPDPTVVTEPDPDPAEGDGDATSVDNSGDPTDQTAEVTANSASGSDDPEALPVGDAAP